MHNQANKPMLRCLQFLAIYVCAMVCAQGAQQHAELLTIN